MYDPAAKASAGYIKSGNVTPKLADLTLDIRKSRGNNDERPLHDTGALANSLVGFEGGIKSEGINYARKHRFGFMHKFEDANKAKPIPKREFSISEVDKPAYNKLVSDFRDKFTKLIVNSLRKR